MSRVTTYNFNVLLSQFWTSLLFHVHFWLLFLDLHTDLSGGRYVHAGFRKGRGTRDQIANIHWIIEKAREFQKNIYFLDYAKAFDCVDHNKLWKILKEMGTNPPASWEICRQSNQEATVRTCMLGLLLLSHFSRVWLCVTPWLAAYQASPSMGFSRQEHWSGLPFPSPMPESGKWK